MVGCAAHPANNTANQTGARTLKAYTKLSREQCRAELFSISDAYMNVAAQGYDQVRTATTRPDVADWAMRSKIASGTTILGDATGSNEAVGLIDLAIFSTMQRRAVQQHWIPTLLGPEGKPLADILATGEAQVWASEGHIFSSDQLQQLRDIITTWAKNHPSHLYVDHIGIAEVAAEKRFTADSPEVISSGSLYGLLYLDPLNALDPVAEQLQAYRAVTERAMFLLPRITIIVGWQADYAATKITTTPEARSFAASAQRLSDVAAQYPQDIAREREAAVQQIAAVLASERKAMINQLDAKLNRAGNLIGQAQRVVAAADKTSADANTAAQNTIAVADQDARRLATLIFVYALVLIVVIAAAVCIVARLRPGVK